MATGSFDTSKSRLVIPFEVGEGKINSTYVISNYLNSVYNDIGTDVSSFQLPYLSQYQVYRYFMHLQLIVQQCFPVL